MPGQRHISDSNACRGAPFNVTVLKTIFEAMSLSKYTGVQR
jgi:hypothetical protein